MAALAGAFITVQGVANSQISREIGTWQTATVTQFTGFLAATLILIFARKARWQKLRSVEPLYLLGGTFAAVVIYSNVTAIRQVGATIAISALLIAQLGFTFLVDSAGWFGLARQKIRLPQVLGICLMIAGVLILGS